MDQEMQESTQLEETGKSPGDEDLKSSSSSPLKSPKDKHSLGGEEEKTMPTTQDLFGDEDLDVSSDEDEEEEAKVIIFTFEEVFLVKSQPKVLVVVGANRSFHYWSHVSG